MMDTSMTHADKNQISSWIGGRKKRYTLLYSADSHGCNSTTFHTNCDNKGPTVTLVYNVNGSVYGGYAGVSWRSGTNESTYDPDAFLFLLRGENQKPCKFAVTIKEYALTMDSSSGPCFGKGPDLLVFKGSITKGTDSFPLSSVISPGTYQLSQETVTEMTGGSFDAKDVQVFSVEDLPDEIPLTRPWRELDRSTWDSELLNMLKRDIEEYWPLREMGVTDDKIPHVNILLLGPVGAGKSSFFNTINSIFRGRLSIQARAGSADTSLTKSYNIYPVVVNGRPLRFRLCDCRGFEDAQGVDLSDVEAILDGHVQNKYMFVNQVKISKENPYYRKDPKMEDRIHCVAIVIDANNDPDYPMTEHVQDQIHKAQELMNQKGIPQLILMNKIDGLSETCRTDLSQIFYSSEVKERVEKLAHALRLPSYSVLPMKNYESEQRLDTNLSILALYNLRQMLHAADDYLLTYLDEFHGDKFEIKML